MLLILSAIVVAAVLSVVLLWYASESYSGIGALAGVAGVIVALAVAITSIVYAFSGWDWFAAEHKAQIINREYGTNYTQEEMFWASNVIETVRQLDRKRYEINGDIMRENAKP